MTYTFQFRDVFAAWRFLLDGLGVTLQLSLVTMVFGLAIGVAAPRHGSTAPLWTRSPSMSRRSATRRCWSSSSSSSSACPAIGVRLDAPAAAIVALTVNLGAYAIEIVRAGLQAIPRSQIEAGHSLGLSGLQVFRHVIVFPGAAR